MCWLRDSRNAGDSWTCAAGHTPGQAVVRARLVPMPASPSSTLPSNRLAAHFSDEETEAQRGQRPWRGDDGHRSGQGQDPAAQGVKKGLGSVGTCPVSTAGPSEPEAVTRPDTCPPSQAPGSSGADTGTRLVHVSRDTHLPPGSCLWAGVTAGVVSACHRSLAGLAPHQH